MLSCYYSYIFVSVALTQKVHFDDAAGSNYTPYLLCEVGENTVLFILHA